MIQRQTRLVAADNSGVKKMKVIHIYGNSKQRFAHIGDIVQCVVMKVNPGGTVKDDELIKVVVIRTRKEKGRSDGSYIRFDDNAGVVIKSKENKNPEEHEYLVQWQESLRS